jgi:S1-C subfamily serine protease
MKARLRWTFFGLLPATVLLCALYIPAQTPAPSPKKPAPASRVAPATPVASRRPAPQVVTILHRLNGLKMIGLLVRGDQQMIAINGLDDAFKVLDQVHTNVIAGLALDDGQTIVARLPELEAELAPSTFEWTTSPPATLPPVQPEKPRAPAPPPPPVPDEFFQTPDVSVIMPGGRKVVARYVGYDAVSGLSVLKIDDKTLAPAAENKALSLALGQHLRLFGPEPAVASTVGGKISVKVGESEGLVSSVTQAPSGGIYRLSVRSERLSPANIGSVAVNDAGDTVGIIVGIRRGEANVLPAAQIRNAVQRVMKRQASVPRPWLGVSGEPVAALNTDRLLLNGWMEPQALALTEARRGILLTTVMPNSPAAVAALHKGDVILTVNGEDIRSADDFSWHLEEAGPGGSVNFTVMRPGDTVTVDVQLKLSGSIEPSFYFPRATTFVWRQSFLGSQGINAIALKPQAAARFGASRGLLVLDVQPDSQASKAGLLPGDVIETIDGQDASIPFRATTSANQTIKLDIVRSKERLAITLGAAQK